MTEHNIYNRISGIIQQRVPAVLCIVTGSSGSTPRKAGAKMIVFADGKTEGTIGGGSVEKLVADDALDILKQNMAVTRSYDLKEDVSMLCGGKVDIYFEPVAANPRLYIFGYGHIGKELAVFAHRLGFDLVIIDNRDGIFDDYQGPPAEKICSGFKDVLPTLPFDANSYIVITTFKHEFDYQVLAECINRSYRYLGMIGSRSKVEQTRRRLKEEQVAEESKINLVDMPIGIRFNAETPAEIAVSIMARLIDVKNRND